MELKKSPKADLQNKKTIFLEIGLVAALGLSILVFSVSQREKVIEKMTATTVAIEEDIAEVTRQDQKPPEPQKQTISTPVDIINLVSNDAKITQNFDFASDFDEDKIFVPQVKVKEEAIAEDTPFLTADIMPTFQGKDINEFRNWVQGRLKYPIIAQENGVQGRVMVTFVVEKDGSLGGIEVLVSPDKSLGDEAIRVIKSSPKWSPGKQRGTPVRIRYNLPVEFRIQ